MHTTVGQFPGNDSVGLYVHVPLCEGKCAYCSFYSEPITKCDADRVVSALIGELERYRNLDAVRTVYVGGGSPTCLGVRRLGRLLDAIAMRPAGVAEWTVECNPGQTHMEMLSMLRERGVNRVSFGVQSFDPEELRFLGRRHGVEDAVRAVESAWEMGFGNVGVDLIYAVPGSTVASWEISLKRAIELGVQHISAYALSIEEGTRLGEMVSRGEVEPMGEETDREMYELTIDVLASAGYEQYEISNFARDGYACEHNIGYWENRPYIGIGPSAGSYWDGMRTMNVSDIRQYVEAVEAGGDVRVECEPVGEQERICETAVLGLRMRKGVGKEAFAARTGVEFGEVFGATVERYRQAGLMEVDAAGVRLSRQALGVADSILCDFAVL